MLLLVFSVFTILPTEYGKSLCYACLPFLVEPHLLAPPEVVIINCIPTEQKCLPYGTGQTLPPFTKGVASQTTPCLKSVFSTLISFLASPLSIAYSPTSSETFLIHSYSQLGVSPVFACQHLFVLKTFLTLPCSFR